MGRGKFRRSLSAREMRPYITAKSSSIFDFHCFVVLRTNASDAPQDLCLNIYGDKSNIFSLINFLSSLLGPQGQSPSFRGHHYQQEILPPRNDDSGEPEGPPDTGQSEGAQDSASPKSSTRKNLGSVTIMIVSTKTPIYTQFFADLSPSLTKLAL